MENQKLECFWIVIPFCCQWMLCNHLQDAWHHLIVPILISPCMPDQDTSDSPFFPLISPEKNNNHQQCLHRLERIVWQLLIGNKLFLYCGLLNVKLKMSWTIKTFSFQRRFNWATHHDCLDINYAETVTRGINWQLRNTAKVYQPVLKSLILNSTKAEWTHLFTEGPFMWVTFIIWPRTP